MGKSRKDYEKFLNSISPDRDDEAWLVTSEVPKKRGKSSAI